MGKISIYNLQGRLIHELWNNVYFGKSGSYIWNGQIAQGKTIAPGLYIIRWDLFNLKAGRKHFQQVVGVTYLSPK